MADKDKPPRTVRFGFENLSPSNRGSTTTKDELLKNAFYEEEAYRVVKRPGLALDTAFSGTCGAGLYAFEDTLLAVVDDDVKSLAAGSSFTAYELRSSNELPIRARGGAMSYGGNLYVMGGSPFDPAGASGYVEKSTDGGVLWSAIADNSAFPERSYFGYCVHNGKMWVSGGIIGDGFGPSFSNGVLYSTDGATWSTARANGGSGGFTQCQRHVMISFDDKLWVIGGRINGGGAAAETDEVWFSADGASWSLATSAPGWAKRNYCGAVVFQDKLWVLGGRDETDNLWYNDVWNTSDGVTWTQITASAAWGAREAPAVFVKNGFIYLGFGKKSTGDETGQDLWKTNDGITWTQVHADMVFGEVSPVAPTGIIHSDGALYIFNSLSPDTLGVDSAVWRSTLDLGSGTIGTITTSCEPVDFAEIQIDPDNKLFLKNENSAWQITGGVLTQITDADYPAETVPGVVSLDSYIFVMTPKAEIYNSDLQTPAAWNPLNFITAEMEPDSGVAIAKHLNYVVALGKWSTEFFYNAANATGSPLARLEASSLWIGCASARSVVNIGNNLIWVAKDRTKGRFVIALEGLTAQRVSTPAIDRILTASTLTTVQSYPVMLDGHLFYVLNLVDDSLTLVMDLTTKKWSVWTTLTAAASKSVSSITRSGETATVTSAGHGYAEGAIVTIAGADQTDYNGDFIAHNITTNAFDITVRNSPVTPATGTITVKGYTESQFIGAYYAFNGDTNYLQDKATGDVYSISSTAYKDGSVPINVRVRTRDHDMDTLFGKFVANMRLHADREDSFVSLRWSDDDFQTYSKFRDKWLDVDPVQFDRLGRFRRRAFEVAHVGNTAFRLAYLEAAINVGDN